MQTFLNITLNLYVYISLFCSNFGHRKFQNWNTTVSHNIRLVCSRQSTVPALVCSRQSTVPALALTFTIYFNTNCFSSIVSRIERCLVGFEYLHKWETPNSNLLIWLLKISICKKECLCMNGCLSSVTSG